MCDWLHGYPAWPVEWPDLRGMMQWLTCVHGIAEWLTFVHQMAEWLFFVEWLIGRPMWNAYMTDLLWNGSVADLCGVI